MKIHHVPENLTGPAATAARLAVILLAMFATSEVGLGQTAVTKPGLPQASGAWSEFQWSQSIGTTVQDPSPMSTIPMSTYSFVAPKDGKTYTGTIVGTSPFAKNLAGTTINAVVVPLVVTIGSVTFDPTQPDPCDSNVSALTRFQSSPLTQYSPLTINGVNVGNTQFINGFRRAEFWAAIGGPKGAAYQNTINFSYIPAQSFTSSGAVGKGPNRFGCVGYLGLLSWYSGILNDYLVNTLIPNLKSSNQISSNQLVIFLTRNIVQYTSLSPLSGVAGFHKAIGSPVQTYAEFSWDTTDAFPGTEDGSVASHELAEWMDDPLATNQTPPWGNVGQTSGCQFNWESGDPLTGKLMPPITLGGYAFHMQELAFFSFFFNSPSTYSMGTEPQNLLHNPLYWGGIFSSSGAFLGPANKCLPGGVASYYYVPNAQ